MIRRILSLFAARPALTPAQEAPSDGCLFGLFPPAGCFFRVSNHQGDSWHVRIERDNETIAHECSLIPIVGESNDEKLIVSAAKRALAAYERKIRVSGLEGCYPPKSVRASR